VTLPGAVAPASRAIRFTETHKLLCHDKTTVQEESVSLGANVYLIPPFLGKLVLPIYAFSLEYIDSVEVAMCAERKLVDFRRTSSMGNYLLLPDLSVAPNSATRMH